MPATAQRFILSAIGQQAKLTAPDGTAYGFGFSVSVDGNTMVIGASNAAYVFVDPGSGWVEAAELTASDDAAGAAFGSSVAISGDSIVVGAPGAGAAYLFREPASGWANMTQTAKLSAPWGCQDFGVSVAISGETVVIGASASHGGAFVFAEPSSGWTDMTATAELLAFDGHDYWGWWSVSISGNTVAVGDPGATVGSNDDQGAVYLFSEPASGWANLAPTATLTASDGEDGAFFGWSVAISGNTVVAGGPNGGPVYLFTEPASGWADMTQTAKLSASDGAAGFGYSVSISGNTILVGAWAMPRATPGASGATAVGSAQQPGAAYLFTEPASGWTNMTQSATVTASDGVAGDDLGISVSISGNTLVAGADTAEVDGKRDQGAAYVFGSPGEQPVYRLYNPVTQEHLFTSDVNESTTLETRGWDYEEIAGNWYSAPATVDGVTDEPMYRLYDPASQQHLWTTDLNEFITLGTRGWTQEGIAGYVFPTAVAASEPLYRLMAPQVHLWTTDLNEYDTLASEGWTQEGICAYVL